ncbi:MAG: nitrous oxide-stimulated promoter family protein, partial [Treponemataceae bacterium]|nr:nitrous oxide-stimulated promoter family protein [Treponemataceae bacterium]
TLYDRAGKKMCPECQELASYAVLCSEKCPRMQEKTFCSNCTSHCYKPEMRDRIRCVMRFSGPRIMHYHPLLAIWHVLCSQEQKRAMKKIGKEKVQEASHDKSQAD